MGCDYLPDENGIFEAEVYSIKGQDKPVSVIHLEGKAGIYADEVGLDLDEALFEVAIIKGRER